MTLQEWCDKNNVIGTVNPSSKAMVVSERIAQEDTDLWHLEDYLVSSVSAGNVWLVPRPQPKAADAGEADDPGREDDPDDEGEWDDDDVEEDDPDDNADEDDEDDDEGIYYDDEDEYEEEYLIDGVGFADPGGSSALRRATASNPRNYTCPTCGRKNVLTLADVRAGYQCDSCADAVERGW